MNIAEAPIIQEIKTIGSISKILEVLFFAPDKNMLWAKKDNSYLSQNEFDETPDAIPLCVLDDILKRYSKYVKLTRESVYLYDWALIPKEVNFMATDSDGSACGWLQSPTLLTDTWMLPSFQSAYFFIEPRFNTFKGIWEKSIEKRPVEYT